LSGAGLIATFFGIGRTPYAPGTAGSLAAALIAWPIARYCGSWALAPLGLAVGLAGIYFAGAYAREMGIGDPKSCVVDEVAGQWIALAAAPATPLGFLTGFLLFRFFDIGKVWPISAAEKLPGGLGIVADDILAGTFAAALVWLFSASGYLT
jgi:phosphatidylglycerophosphatase A